MKKSILVLLSFCGAFSFAENPALWSNPDFVQVAETFENVQYYAFSKQYEPIQKKLEDAQLLSSVQEYLQNAPRPFWKRHLNNIIYYGTKALVVIGMAFQANKAADGYVSDRVAFVKQKLEENQIMGGEISIGSSDIISFADRWKNDEKFCRENSEAIAEHYVDDVKGSLGRGPIIDGLFRLFLKQENIKDKDSRLVRKKLDEIGSRSWNRVTTIGAAAAAFYFIHWALFKVGAYMLYRQSVLDTLSQKVDAVAQSLGIEAPSKDEEQVTS